MLSCPVSMDLRHGCGKRMFSCYEALMVTMPAQFFIPLILLLLTGCGQNLGAYSVEAVNVTSDVPMAAETAAQYGQFVEIRLSSETSLTAFDNNVIDAVYVDADFCPLSEEKGVIAFGPFSANGDDLGLPSASAPLRRSADGKFQYRIYLPLAYQAARATKLGQPRLPTYDLRKIKVDLCLQLFAPGYNVIQSRSETIKVPAKLILAAQKEGASS